MQTESEPNLWPRLEGCLLQLRRLNADAYLSTCDALGVTPPLPVGRHRKRRGGRWHRMAAEFAGDAAELALDLLTSWDADDRALGVEMLAEDLELAANNRRRYMERMKREQPRPLPPVLRIVARSAPRARSRRTSPSRSSSTSSGASDGDPEPAPPPPQRGGITRDRTPLPVREERGGRRDG